MYCQIEKLTFSACRWQVLSPNTYNFISSSVWLQQPHEWLHRQLHVCATSLCKVFPKPWAHINFKAVKRDCFWSIRSHPSWTLQSGSTANRLKQTITETIERSALRIFYFNKWKVNRDKSSISQMFARAWVLFSLFCHQIPQIKWLFVRNNKVNKDIFPILFLIFLHLTTYSISKV